MENAKKINYDYLITHGGCPDGEACAWVINKKYPNINIIRASRNYPINFDILKNTNTICTDFVYNEKDTKLVYDKTNFLTMLDHHVTQKSIIDNYAKKSDTYAVYDNDKCGAILAWEFCFDDKPIPKFLQYIDDRDRWQWKLPNSKLVNKVFYVKELNESIDKIDKIYENELENEHYYEELAIIGKNYEEYENKLLKDRIKYAKIKNYKNLKVSVCESTDLRSDLGNKMVNELDCDFAAVFSYDPYKKKYFISLRSRDDKADVGKIAKNHGGGGHRNASGLSVKNITKLFKNKRKKKWYKKMFHTIF